MQNVFNVSPKYSEYGKYVYVRLNTRRTYQYICIYEEDEGHVMIDTGLYEYKFVVPNTIEDIENFLKSYREFRRPSNNAVEVFSYRRNNKQKEQLK